MEKKFEFKKTTGNKYAFIMETEDLKRTEVVDKEFVKKHYEELRAQRNEMQNNLSKIKKDLEFNKTEHNDELEKFIELANQAAKYKKYQDLTQNHKSVIEMLNNINESMKAIETELPELTRKK